MTDELDFTIIYCEFDEVRGPIVKVSYPDELEEKLSMQIAGKAIEITSNDKNINSQSSAFIPYADINKKGIVRALEWKDQALRGNSGLGAIVLLFKEEDDLIFYKYIKDLKNIFNSATKIIAKLKPSTANNEDIFKEVKEIHTEFTKKLGSLQSQEQAWREDIDAFPEDDTSEINKFKVVVCGDPGCGKTSSILRLTSQAFRRTYLPTMGVNITRKDLKVGKIPVFLILWDLAGETKFQYVRHKLYEGARAFVLMYDVTRKQTYESIHGWYNDIKKNLRSKREPIFILCGNKIDLKDERIIDTEEGIKLGEELGIRFLETSALTGQNIDNSFNVLASNLVKK